MRTEKLSLGLQQTLEKPVLVTSEVEGIKAWLATKTRKSEDIYVAFCFEGE